MREESSVRGSGFERYLGLCRFISLLCIYAAMFLSIGHLNASGFKVPEQSLQQSALSSAYFASSRGADTSYVNPANMGFADVFGSKNHDLSMTLSLIYIPKFSFSVPSTNKGLSSTTTLNIPDSAANMANMLGVDLRKPIHIQHSEADPITVTGSAPNTLMPMPKIFYKAKPITFGRNAITMGASLTVPSGLGMSWGGKGGEFLQDVLIFMVELSPSISYTYNDRVSFGFTPRFLYGQGSFNNVVYVPLDGKVKTNLGMFDKIPAALVPPDMEKLVYGFNTMKGGAGAAALAGGGADWENRQRFDPPIVGSTSNFTDAWFGAIDPKTWDAHNVEAYNAKVKENNARVFANWDRYQNNLKTNPNLGNYRDGELAHTLPTAFMPVTSGSYNANGMSKNVAGLNYCLNKYKGNGGSFGWLGARFYGCQNVDQAFLNKGKYLDCYTGTEKDFNGKDAGYYTCETNPSKPMGYKPLLDAKQLSEKFGMGNMSIATLLKGTARVEQKSSGKGVAFGYKAAMSVRTFDRGMISVMYQSPIKFKLKGGLKATTYIGGAVGDILMDADFALGVTLPAVLSVGISQNFGSFNIEGVYERTFWSKGDKFTFDFSNPKFTALTKNSAASGFSQRDFANMMSLADYSAIAMGDGWHDTNSFRLGASLGLFKERLRLMASFAYDEAPVPQNKLGIPDSDGYMMGGGFIYFWRHFDFGLSYSHTIKDNRKSIYHSDKLGAMDLASAQMSYRW